MRQALDFAQVNATLEGLAIDRSRWPEIYEQLEVMEAEALTTLAEIRR